MMVVVYTVACALGEISIFPAGQVSGDSHHRNHQLLSDRGLRHLLVFYLAS